MRGSADTNFLFTLGEVTRMVRAWADREAGRYGITRAQWAVLAKVERNEGLKQSELAEQLEMQPITLTRLIDKLCDNGWIERHHVERTCACDVQDRLGRDRAREELRDEREELACMTVPDDEKPAGG